jgi:hypothetical protein
VSAEGHATSLNESIEPGPTALIHVDPPSVVRMIAPLAPAAKQVDVLAQLTAYH